jgi:UDP-N-acetylmuramate dehydrogenase
MFSQFSSSKNLAELTTLGIGGKARYYIEVRDISTMQKVLRFCKLEGVHYVIIGKGSNCLFSDDGFSGLVIHNKIDFCHEVAPFRFYVGAGFSFALLGTQTAKRGISGLEFASGIPASIGGAIYMNAGAQGYSTSQCLQSVDFVNEEGRLVRYEKEKLDFSYRYSSFHKLKGAIVAATFSLIPAGDASLKLRDLLEYRLKTQPYHEKSAGCIFRNPVGISAGALIERCGMKGAIHGGAKVSEMHANFIVNMGGATCLDMLTLIEKVQKKVKDDTGFHLEKELVHIHG